MILTYLDYILYRECIVSTQDNKIKKKLQNAFKAVGNVNLKNLKEWEFKFRDSIEHFYPQNPSGDSIERINDNKILNSFGNLALVTTSGNSKFSNLAPSAKQTTYPNIIIQSLKLILMSACINGNNIDEYKQAISEHEKEMLTLLRVQKRNNII
ncbi:GmrSD restriction endonuclease domain-containing protein [Campylobacter concisus]|uniref:GmrSD restriction endonuclease domain-containing protein n=1 Tax=Campylobacter concisus TaxID=199 RepID=UPI000CD9695E